MNEIKKFHFGSSDERCNRRTGADADNDNCEIGYSDCVRCDIRWFRRIDDEDRCTNNHPEATMRSVVPVAVLAGALERIEYPMPNRWPDEKAAMEGRAARDVQTGHPIAAFFVKTAYYLKGENTF
ncbi:hypothetical protein WM34_21250 [Burkholderia ubonensis]|nr:hypothetical protein WJ52_11575 [Burkholderia ubonensis]KVM21797.1 hypothetical protein WJ51_03745 [Burkholderia ubonensis]KVM44003.1 hypothetical protein WJ56_28485 [Burkholderia ubonensis]KVO04366.1 hypothetical protein WJ71_13670 [Burkholderia ubonensis]KVO85630.1 hypothetical protein WJ80_10925 [Burkholderia ubonensis]